MGRIQRFIRARSGSNAAAVEAESRAWHIQCPVCSTSKSIWDLGGVRYKAASTGKRIRGHCSTCGTRRWLHYVRIDPAISPPPEAGGADADHSHAHEGEAAVEPARRSAEGAPRDSHPTDRPAGDGTTS
ncbi:MAG: hypothetical protein ACE367_20145 [Acidimicrobiales bacterium]